MPKVGAEGDGVLVGAQERDVVVAEQMEARLPHRPELGRDLGHQGAVGGTVDVGDAVAEVEHGIRPAAVGEVEEAPQQRQGGRAALGAGVGAVVDVGDDRELQGVGHRMRFLGWK